MSHQLMRLHEIKALFAPGSIWECSNTLFPHRDGLRKVKKVASQEIIWTLLDGPDQGKDYYTPIPKASEITHSDPAGRLDFTKAMPGGLMTMSLRLLR